MRNVRIGIVGLGNIAQKAYLPILTKETDWSLVGAYSPTKEKRKRICKQYRMQDYNSLPRLLENCDAIFVHSSTDSHFEIVSQALRAGVEVYVDKPLAATVTEAEKLVELANNYNRKLMVGFNRRFAPMYMEAKENVKNLAWVRFDKHRANKVGPDSYQYKMLDDYIHLVDTVRWLADGNIHVVHHQLKVNERSQLLYANHMYESSDQVTFHTTMHRKAGTNLEQLELVGEDAVIRVKNMNIMEIEQNNSIITKNPSSWETVLKQRGFEDAIHHFIKCIQHDTQPIVNGEEGLQSQILVEKLMY
ncbi:Gfo/Idh/MocA family protein [Ornithinibacillus salinisoli]|uniref:Gfo/Idh/MocA family protein n=1 Tax=Ornithinibacillus salinisoli TaxID=1848459 RepID=A0ABW4VZY8_9BACI